MFAVQSPIGTTSGEQGAIRGRAHPATAPFAPDVLDASHHATRPGLAMLRDQAALSAAPMCGARLYAAHAA